MTIRIQIHRWFIFIPYMDGNRSKWRGRYIKPKLQKVYHLNIMYIHKIFMEIWFQSHPVFVLMYSSSNSFIRGKSLQSEEWFSYARVPFDKNTMICSRFFLPSKLMENVFWRYKRELDARSEFVGYDVHFTSFLSSDYSQ